MLRFAAETACVDTDPAEAGAGEAGAGEAGAGEAGRAGGQCRASE